MRIRRPSPAMVVACLALGVALSGSGYAALKLPRNSVGTKQLRNSAVTNKKLARRAVTAAKVAPNALTGVQIKESTLGTVRSATRALNADTAVHASSADNAVHAVAADSAGSAQSIAAAEPFHVVGATGQPGFQHSWVDKGGTFDLPAGFYKDRAGVVHLRGRVSSGSANNVIFQLPAGYRPASGKGISFPAACECTAGQATIVTIQGSGFSAAANGSVTMVNGTLQASGSLFLDGISYLAES